MDSSARFRVVTSEEQAPRRRGPGPAVLLVAFYALLFAGGLWLLRAKSPLLPKKTAPFAGRESKEASPSRLPRAALLEAAGLSPLARMEYFLRLSADCCPCGCDLNLRDCLLSDQTCVKSPELANAIFRQLS